MMHYFYFCSFIFKIRTLKQIYFTAICITLFFNNGFSQDINPRVSDYKRADSIALSIPKNKKYSVDDLSLILTKDLTTDHEKCRVIFRWITENIAYSFSNKTGDVQKVLQKRVAVCMGYAALFQAMCRKAGLECETVTGFAKITPEDIGVKLTKSNHSWNIIKLYGTWYLIDATWAAGNYTNKFVKDFDESYYLSDPRFLILSHYPEDSKYQYLDTIISAETFIRYPIVYSGLMKNKLQLKTIPDGKLKRDVKIQFSTTSSIANMYGMFEGDKVSTVLEYKSNNSDYFVDYKLPLISRGNYTFFVNGKAVFGFRK